MSWAGVPRATAGMRRSHGRSRRAVRGIPSRPRARNVELAVFAPRVLEVTSGSSPRSIQPQPRTGLCCGCAASMSSIGCNFSRTQRTAATAAARSWEHVGKPRCFGPVQCGYQDSPRRRCRACGRSPSSWRSRRRSICHRLCGCRRGSRITSRRRGCLLHRHWYAVDLQALEYQQHLVFLMDYVAGALTPRDGGGVRVLRMGHEVQQGKAVPEPDR